VATTARTTKTRPASGRPTRNRHNGHSPDPQYAKLGTETQAFDTMRNLPIGLKEEVREASCELLNEILADTTVLYALYKKHHWNVAGPTFYQLHLLFDKHAEEQLALIDGLAERVQMLGGIAVGDPRHAAELTTIERPPDGAEDVPAEITRLLKAHETIIATVRDGIEATEKSKDWGSNDLLMSDVLRRHEMQVWFLSEHLVDDPLIED
jgi:starvation-inducible DNA-binding protein